MDVLRLPFIAINANLVYFSNIVFFWPRVHNIESWGIYYFGSGPSNVLPQTPYQIIWKCHVLLSAVGKTHDLQSDL